MNVDNPRPWKKDVTKGEWVWKEESDTDCGSFKPMGGGERVCWFGSDEEYYNQCGTPPNEADRELILEASRVLHQTGMTPGELAERVKELELVGGKLLRALENLYYLVQGECPSLLEDDHHYFLVTDACTAGKGVF